MLDLTTLLPPLPDDAGRWLTSPSLTLERAPIIDPTWKVGGFVDLVVLRAGEIRVHNNGEILTRGKRFRASMRMKRDDDGLWIVCGPGLIPEPGSMLYNVEPYKEHRRAAPPIITKAIERALMGTATYYMTGQAESLAEYIHASAEADRIADRLAHYRSVITAFEAAHPYVARPEKVPQESVAARSAT